MDTPGQRLRWARERTGKFATATEAAHAFGWTVSTYLGHENGDRNPSRGAAKKYGAAYKVPWEWILEGGPLPGSKARRKTEDATIPTKGEVATGLWLDLDVELDAHDFEQFPIAADPRYPFEAQYGLIVRGTSLNRLAGDGDVLHCLDLGISAVEPEENDVVIVERRRAQLGQKEVTAKRIRRNGAKVILSPDSTDKKWRPIEFDPAKGSDDVDVAVIGLVLAIYKPLRKR